MTRYKKRKCANCGREFTPAHHSQRYHSDECLREVRRADRQKLDIKPMTSDEFVKLLHKLELNETEAARVFGFSPRMARRYVADDSAVPPPLAKLMRLMLREKISTKTIERL